MNSRYKKIKISDFPHNFADFVTPDKAISQVIWAESSCYRHNKLPSEGPMKLSHFIGELKGDNGYLRLKAERYATGILGHGGGVRVGNIGNLQIKGVGPNSLLSKSAPAWYSYGGMNLVDGALDCTISAILNSLRAGFCTDALMLLATSSDAALRCDNITKDKLFTYKMDDYEPCWGGALIRRPELRPAHLLPSIKFSNEIARSHGLITEDVRVERIWRLVSKKLDEPRNVIEWILDFGLAAADILAFARSYGIVHGGLTASNLTMYGSWLDLNSVRYMPYIADSKPYHEEELETVLNATKRLLRSYSKHEKLTLKTDVLANYIKKSYSDSLKRYYGQKLTLISPSTPLGLETHVAEDLSPYELKDLCIKLLRLHRKQSLCRNSKEHLSYTSCDHLRALQELKRSCVAESLSLGEIRIYYEELISSLGIDYLAKSVSAHINEVEWLLNDPEGICRICKDTSGNEILYCSANDSYLLTTSGNHRTHHSALLSALGHIDYRGSISEKYLTSLQAIEDSK